MSDVEKKLQKMEQFILDNYSDEQARKRVVDLESQLKMERAKAERYEKALKEIASHRAVEDWTYGDIQIAKRVLEGEE